MQKLATIRFLRPWVQRLTAHPLDLARLVRIGKRAVASAFGGSVRCDLCGRRIGRVFPVVWRGRLEVWGADAALVQVEFEERNALRFRHVLAENCPALRKHESRS